MFSYLMKECPLLVFWDTDVGKITVTSCSTPRTELKKLIRTIHKELPNQKNCLLDIKAREKKGQFCEINFIKIRNYSNLKTTLVCDR